VTPDTLLHLANLTVARRPAGSPTSRPDPLATPAGAAREFGLSAITAAQLQQLRELHRTVVALTEALLGGHSPTRPIARLNRLARSSAATARLREDDGRLVVDLRWSDATPAAQLARRVVMELAEIDPTRLRRCQRRECDLLFYDTTRSATRRWHAESPCGIRERQRRHRRAGATVSPD
jgi:predicted RNA-binding Zn ribbon-like protein